MTVHGSCHCGATRFELTEPPTSLTRCNCTFCTKRGVLWAYCAPEQFRLTSSEQDGLYEKSGSPIKHHHCVRCGCGTYTQSPEWVDFKPHPTRVKIGVNVNLFDDFDVSELPVQLLDGRNLW
jgi:hypothetical protein